jgi:hypothetical protein
LRGYTRGRRRNYVGREYATQGCRRRPVIWGMPRFHGLLSKVAPRVARRAESPGPELVGELVSLNVETIRLARALMIAQEEADVLERTAGAAIDAAAEDPGDEELTETAVFVAAAASEAAEIEMEATHEWGGHIEMVHDLVDRAALPPAGPAPRLPRIVTGFSLRR